MPDHKAFTLIELLVVVTIIALLAAVLIPSLAAAREQARTTVCLSNCRQIATAVQAYRIEFHDTFPPALCLSEDKNWNQFWLAVLSRYAKQPLVFRCPEDDAAQFLDWSRVNWETLTEAQREEFSENYHWASYAANYLIVKQPDAGDVVSAPYSDHMSRIRRPMDTILTGEARSSAMGVDHIHPEMFLTMPPERQLAAKRHRGKSNYVFADGHAETLRFDQTWIVFKRNCWDPKSAPGWGAAITPPPPPPSGP